MPEIIFDTCVLSNFALSGSFDLIKRLYERRAYVSNYVAAEIMRGLQRGYGDLIVIQQAIDEGWLKELNLESKEEKSLFFRLSISLGLGEASSISLAKSRGLVFASDDVVARREAALLGISLTGTLGILSKAKKKKLISLKKADQVLQRMINHGFHSPVRSLKDLPSPQK
ncbi:MAG: DUF3368 domain-containing protein [Candidatus Aminicenantes bacterium]|nr:DUF3368 domain-containing protein [Candidatus Aminicenantes bacterium]